MTNLNLTQEQILQAIANLDAKQQSKLFAKTKNDSDKFKEKEKATEQKIKSYLQGKIETALDEARQEIKEKFESCEWLETCIDSTKQYIAIGVNFNPKVETNNKDKKFKTFVSFRTYGETAAAEKKQAKDKAKTIKISSHKVKTSFEKSQVGLESTLNKIAKRSGIKTN